MEQKFNDELMPTVGVYCTMACDDYQPPRLLSASESEAINPGTMPIPKEGTVGYVKVESKHYEGPELKPRWFDVDDFNDMSDEELADLGKLRDDAGRIHDALYLDDAGRPARDAKGRLLDAMPSIGGYVYNMEEPAEDYQVETVNVGFEPKRVINI